MLWECKEGCKLNQPKSAGHPGECPKHGRAYAYTPIRWPTEPEREVNSYRCPDLLLIHNTTKEESDG